MNKFIAYLLILLIPAGVSSCGVYSFSGGAVPPEIKTFSVQNIYNESGQGPANLSQNITEKLKAYYQANTKLSLVRSDGDWNLEGKIVGYFSTGVAPKANETSGSNRLTIVVKIAFTNTYDEKQNFESDFSFFQDYSQEKSLTDVENTLSEQILDQIVMDIFQKTTSNW